ncbi:MAG TPA: O-antigen ligase family protein [Candidatus Levybacteria bacterium]|nr:O-antigen ligase family protein [Candidatus Levybacteria bacterium]
MSIIVSKYSMPALYGSVKALEMIFLGYMVSRRFSEKDSALLVFLLSGAIVVQGILVITQMVTQSSVGGIWYLLGERTFSVASIGISTVSLFGKEILRAYGSFPHPNVLAFFMLMANLFVLARFSQVSDLRQKVWYCIALGIGVISLLSTFSRISILLFFSIVFYLSFRRHISRLIGSVLVLLGTGFVLIFIQRFTLSVLYSNDFTARLDLAVIAFKIIAQHLIFGVGMYNYFYYQIDYQRDISPVLLQPPHNIYLLFFLQVGFFGFLAVLFFLWKTFLRAKHNISISVLSLQGIASLLFFCILLIGFWDHYLVTLQQGMIMTAFIIGLVWLSKK